MMTLTRGQLEALRHATMLALSTETRPKRLRVPMENALRKINDALRLRNARDTKRRAERAGRAERGEKWNTTTRSKTVHGAEAIL